MWELGVTGKTDEIYKKLRDAFNAEYVEEVERDDGHGNSLGKGSKSPEGSSEQLRRAMKFVQSAVELFDGELVVVVKGEPGKSLEVSLEQI